MTSFCVENWAGRKNMAISDRTLVHVFASLLVEYDIE